MLTLLIAVIALTLVISWLCSLLEGFILSITTAEIESVKAQHPLLGTRLEFQKNNIERATAAILTVNTLANIAGSSIGGYLCGELFGSTGVAILTVALTLVVLFFCEILPKSMGFFFRRRLAIVLTPILDVLMWLLQPISGFSRWLVHVLLPRRGLATEEEREQEVLLLVNKGHQDGFFSLTERSMISNTLRLDDLPVSGIITPLERIVALPADEPLTSVMRHIGTSGFSRLPVYENSHIIGMVTRSDLLHASALDNHQATVRGLMKPVLKLPGSASIADLLQHLLKNRQEMCIIEGTSSQTLGLATMEDIVKHLLGARPVRR